MEGLHDFPDLAGLEGQLLIDLLAFLIPAPGVFEGANLAGGVGAVLFVEEGVVVLGGVEGRVQIDEINRLVLQIPPHDVEIVAVIKRAHAPSVAGSLPVRNAPQWCLAVVESAAPLWALDLASGDVDYFVYVACP